MFPLLQHLGVGTVSGVKHSSIVDMVFQLPQLLIVARYSL